MTGAVPGFDVTTFAHAGREHEVYRAGAGPAVVVIHEVPGLHPGVIAFGQRLADAGYRVYLPSLFGHPGAPPTGRETLRVLPQVCVSREFTLLANRTSPVATWLRALAAQAHAECGGPGVGAVGMCFTGGFALAMAVEPAVLAPVLSQPGLPAPVTARNRAGVGLDPADLAVVRQRAHDGLCVLGLRFSADRGAAAQPGQPPEGPGSSSWAGRRRTVTPPMMAQPTTRTRGAPGEPGALAEGSKPPIRPRPATSTATCSGTVMLMPPIRQNARMVTSAAAKVACRRSRSTPPQMATAWYAGGTTQGPVRRAPHMIATEAGAPVAPAMTLGGAAGRGAGTAGPITGPGRSLVIARRSAKVFAA
jgi:Dienelactone hydrolase family